MSRIYFHSEHETAEVRGSERAHMGIFCGDLFNAALGLEHEAEYGNQKSIFRRILKPGHYLNNENGRFVESLKTALAVSWQPVFTIEGEDVSTFTAVLNTACLIGNDVVKLMARLHGQCEIHCWVNGPNRAWLAGLIETGCEIGLLRESEQWKSGWDKAVMLLHSRDDCPVVTSYSVCEQFPNPSVTKWKPPKDGDGEPDYDKWYELPDAEQWRLGMEGLKTNPLLEMKPDNWQAYYFGDSINAFKIRAAANRATAAA